VYIITHECVYEKICHGCGSASSDFHHIGYQKNHRPEPNRRHSLKGEFVNLSSDLIAGADAAAQFTGLTARAIYHLVDRGQLPVTRLGRRLYFRKSELTSAFSNVSQAA
jgi:excisionase family DNA binding protein